MSQSDSPQGRPAPPLPWGLGLQSRGMRRAGRSRKKVCCVTSHAPLVHKDAALPSCPMHAACSAPHRGLAAPAPRMCG